MRVLTVKGVRIDDTFAEAFGMRATALTITADTARWARQAAVTMTGFATSVIGCGCEAGIDCELTAKQTPDGRPGVRVLLFATSTTELQKQLQARVGQCVLTSPGSACYAGIEGEETLKLGNALRYFGDGWQISKRFGSQTLLAHSSDGWRVCLRSQNGRDEEGGGRRQSYHHWPHVCDDQNCGERWRRRRLPACRTSSRLFPVGSRVPVPKSALNTRA